MQDTQHLHNRDFYNVWSEELAVVLDIHRPLLQEELGMLRPRN